MFVHPYPSSYRCPRVTLGCGWRRAGSAPDRWSPASVPEGPGRGSGRRTLKTPAREAAVQGEIKIHNINFEKKEANTQFFQGPPSGYRFAWYLGGVAIPYTWYIFNQKEQKHTNIYSYGETSRGDIEAEATEIYGGYPRSRAPRDNPKQALLATLFSSYLSEK